jgi:GT2 family glycosyltransferase
MTRIPTSPPVIAPLANAKERPLWSVMIPVYNCGQFLPETLESVLAQAIPEDQMQIEVVDDASTDQDVKALVEKIGGGRIHYFRQPQNVGSLRNFETCLNRSRGQLVHLLHGDDTVAPGYYRQIEQLFEQFPQAGAAFCRYRCIDETGQKVYDKTPERKEDGLLANWLPRIGARQQIQYVAMTVKREVYEKLGGFYGIDYAEDWEMWVRVARHYPVAYTPQILAFYRQHKASISGSKILTGAYLQDLASAMGMIQAHLPQDKQHQILQDSRRYYASYGLQIARRLWNQGHDPQVVKTQIKQALLLYKSPTLYLTSLKLQAILHLHKVWHQVSP